MPSFKIEMELANQNEKVTLTNFSTENPTGLTFNENLTEEQNSHYNLTFDIAKQNNIDVGAYIIIGRPIWLTMTNPDKLVRLVISNYSPKITPDNIIYTVETQDYASYAFARNNVGLNLDTINGEPF